MFEKICAPALIYLVFSLTQIIIDTITGLYNTALMKLVVATMVTFLLNTLCNRELTVISWLIVFVPFILMTTIVSILLYVFGLDVARGKFKRSSSPTNLPIITPGTMDSISETLSESRSESHPEPKLSPKDINPNPPHGLSEYYYYENPPFGTSSPEYESFSLFSK